MRRALCRAAALALWLLGAAAHAEVHRAAVLVGNNTGSELRTPLRYAESDAAKVARVLIELGGFSREDVYLLRGRDANTLRSALAGVRQKVSTWRAKDVGFRTEILFYFSGHSDGLALELGAERVGFDELKQWAAGSGADVRLLIVDSCKSGSLLASKGGSLSPGFEIQMMDSLASTGEALLTSSAADEAALESEDLHGSVFSHNLVSGLRGAADVSGDGRVTLDEAYHYAFAHTLSETSRTIYGPQHAGYDFRLSGQGDLVLTEITHPLSVMEVPDGYDRVVVSSASQGVLAEARRGSGRRIALPPGRYDLHAWRRREQFHGGVDVGPGAVRAVAAEELVAWHGSAAVTKGAADESRGEATPAISTTASTARDDGGGATWPALGVAGALGRSLGSPHGSVGARLEVASPRPSGFVASLTWLSAGGWTGAGASDDETSLVASIGYRLGSDLRRGGFRLRVHAGLEAAGGFVRWRSATGSASSSQFTTAPCVLAAPELGLALPLGDAVALSLTGEYALALSVRDREVFTAGVPRVFAGVQATF